MSILITICARGGSKGIPGKNIKVLNGQPLIAYTINIAKKFEELHSSKITLSTDDEKIAKTAANYGLMSEYRRPVTLASDSAGKIDTIRDVLLYEERKTDKPFDFILDLDITSPLRTLEDLESAFNDFKNNKNALSLFSVNKAARNPYFNMVEEGKDGFVKLVKSSSSAIMTRQSAPEVYDLNASFYFYRRSFFNLGLTSPITDKSLVYVMPHICFDLDHTIDFDFLQFLMQNQKLGFEI